MTPQLSGDMFETSSIKESCFNRKIRDFENKSKAKSIKDHLKSKEMI
jgi:hypothetical protein